MADSRIDVFTEALREAVGDCFDVNEGSADSTGRVVSARYAPHRRGAAAILVAYCENNWHVEITGMPWFFDDYQEFLGWDLDENGDSLEPSRTEATRWAIDACVNVARFGVARVRPRWMPFAPPFFRISCALDSDGALDDLLIRNPRWKLVKRWRPW